MIIFFCSSPLNQLWLCFSTPSFLLSKRSSVYLFPHRLFAVPISSAACERASGTRFAQRLEVCPFSYSFFLPIRSVSFTVRGSKSCLPPDIPCNRLASLFFSFRGLCAAGSFILLPGLFSDCPLRPVRSRCLGAAKHPPHKQTPPTPNNKQPPTLKDPPPNPTKPQPPPTPPPTTTNPPPTKKNNPPPPKQNTSLPR